MKTYQQLFELFSSHINAANYGANPKELYEPINYMMQLGGKRLRPILALMACDLFDSYIEKALHAAHAIEVFHNFTLVHDDIMDNAPLRRGKETVYKKWNMPIAILSGDLMMIKATQLLCETETTHLKLLLDIFNRTAIEVCEGQQIDMNFETQKSVSHDEYLEMIKLKTAVLLGCSLQLGALIGGANNGDALNLYEFGKNIGIAFQIQDDILDTFGDGTITGKQVGGDIIANKKTLLLIELFESVHKDDKKLLDDLMQLTDTEQKVQSVINLYDKYLIKQFAESKKQQYLDLAYKHLADVSVDETKKSILINTAEGLMNRVS
ncbi:MAG: polyprenyl synthetase family protein [Bacteroidota bacterium]|jgi:geranylgeranyl diphosphate synthase type II